MNDIDFNPGGIQDTLDSRDFHFGDEIGHASPPFYWDKGYDIEKELGTILNQTNFQLPSKDQGNSSSCGGNAWGYLGHVLDIVHDKENNEKSAKFIYAQTFAPGGGSAGRTNCELVIKQGWAPESLCASYSNGNPLTESDYEKPQDITTEAREAAKLDKAFAYANVSLNIDTIAQAIRDNYGVIIGLSGSNNGTWRTAYPKPPTTSDIWRHWLYAGKAVLVNGEKYIGIKNSWGDSTGYNGWQYIHEDYFKKFIDGAPAIWSIWTMVVKDEPLPPTFKHEFTHSLKYGMVEPEVQFLQTALQLDGCFPTNINPVNRFGFITLSSVMKFQRKYGLGIDGKVGPLTNAKLNELFNK